MQGADGRTRVIIENVEPQIDGGRFPIKRVPGESVTVQADIYTDGHDAVSAVLRSWEAGSSTWRESPMEFLVNDRWTGEFSVRNIGTTCYTILAWVDHFKSWSRDFSKRLTAEQDLTNTIPQEIPLQREIGARLVDLAAASAPADEAGMLRAFADRLRDKTEDPSIGVDPLLSELMFHFAPRNYATSYEPELAVTVDRVRARFSSWYELFPRSISPVEGQHGTFKDVEQFLPRLAGMGFDVVYLPPIHPIGRTHRKGPSTATSPPMTVPASRAST